MLRYAAKETAGYTVVCTYPNGLASPEVLLLEVCCHALDFTLAAD